jgi:hypothetical protein
VVEILALEILGLLERESKTKHDTLSRHRPSQTPTRRDGIYQTDSAREERRRQTNRDAGADVETIFVTLTFNRLLGADISWLGCVEIVGSHIVCSMNFSFQGVEPD